MAFAFDLSMRLMERAEQLRRVKRDRSAAPATLAVALLAATVVAMGCQRSETPPLQSAPPQVAQIFVGAAKCAGCHPKEAEAYRASDHARAMQPATEETVLGDFRGSQFRHHGVTSTFSRRDGKFFVQTDGPDGRPGEFEIGYTFGVKPLQQYLVSMPGGRLQALGVAWDSRPKSTGGQRWFHLYPTETLRASDPLHWTGREQNWNYQCAECHSTDLRKNYDTAQDRYATAWVIDPRFVPAILNLADLFRAQGREEDAERFIEQALAVAPDSAEALHALGLLRVRQGRRAEAVDLLRRAAERRPESARFAYVYAVGLHDTGASSRAIAVLEQAHRARPADRDVLMALVTYLAERGDVSGARRYIEALSVVSPGEARRALDSLSGRASQR